MSFMLIMLGIFFVLGVVFVLGMVLRSMTFAPQATSLFNAGNVRQRYRIRSMGERSERRAEKGFKTRPDPKHQLGTLQSFGIRWFQTVDMRRAETSNNEMRFANPFHHRGDQGMYRFDGGDNLRTWLLRMRRANQHEKCYNDERQQGFHDKAVLAAMRTRLLIRRPNVIL